MPTSRDPVSRTPSFSSAIGWQGGYSKPAYSSEANRQQYQHQALQERELGVDMPPPPESPPLPPPRSEAKRLVEYSDSSDDES